MTEIDDMDDSYAEDDDRPMASVDVEGGVDLAKRVI
jgi:hypothetical protein